VLASPSTVSGEASSSEGNREQENKHVFLGKNLRIMFSKRTNQWNLPYNVYNPVAEKRRDMENDAAIYKRWRKEQNQLKKSKDGKNVEQ